MTRTKWGLTAFALAAMLLALTSRAGAVDGVVLVDQARALAGNVTPGDAPGFPVTLSRAGSYRLSSNLTVPAGVNGIEITEDNVTLDLNGFTITGSGASARGIVAPAAQAGIAIRNGVVDGFGDSIRMFDSTHANIQDMRLYGSLSIVTGGQSIIRNNIATGLIQVACPSIIQENVTDGFISQVTNNGTCVKYHNRSLVDAAAISE
jgi:hypothetical protein